MIEHYDHHGFNVAVQSHLRGKHKEHCLCHQCNEFKPEDRKNNCHIANLMYAVCCAFGITTPVWECPNFSATGFSGCTVSGEVGIEKSYGPHGYSDSSPCPDCGMLMQRIGRCQICRNCGFSGGCE